MINSDAPIYPLVRRSLLGDSFSGEAFILFLARLLFLRFIPSRGADIVSLDCGLWVCHDRSTPDTLVGYRFAPRILKAPSCPLYETKGILQQSPFIPNHLYRGPPILRRPISPVAFKVV